MHDLRNLGYKRLRAVDPVEDNLRSDWYKAKDALVDAGLPDTGAHRQAFNYIDKRLSDYLWNRAKTEVEADRQRHPKALRNQPKPSDIETGEGRVIK